MAILASVVMDAAANLMNDSAKSVYSYAVQVPYLNIALSELKEEMEANNVPFTNKTSAAIIIAAGVTSITVATTPALPTDLIEIQSLWERLSGTTNDYEPMSRAEFLPLTAVQSTSLMEWSWEGQSIKFIGATTIRDVIIEYIADTLAAVVDGTTSIALFNCKTYLTYKTAALCARYIGEDTPRADVLEKEAVIALDRFGIINVKGRQEFSTRRRPFRSSFKNRGIG